MNRIVSPQNSYVAILTPTTSESDYRDFKELIKVKRGHTNGP